MEVKTMRGRNYSTALRRRNNRTNRSCTFYYCYYRTMCFNIMDRKSECWNRTFSPWLKRPTTVCRPATSINRAWYLARAELARRRRPNLFCSICARWPATWARGLNSRYLKLTQFWNLLVRIQYYIVTPIL